MKKYNLQGYAFTEDNLICLIVLVLGIMGGKGSKKQVEETIYDLFRNEFKKDYWHEKVAYGIPRWKHYIAWAKERAKQIHNFIKTPEQSGRGYWELTGKGKEYCIQIKVEFMNEICI